MKTSFYRIMVFTGLLSLFGCSNSTDPSHWNAAKIDRWFEKGEWLGGWKVKPDATINRKEFAISYFKQKERWDKSFAFLKENDLTKMELKRYDIDGENIYATVAEYMTKNEEDSRYESHQRYIDIQYVISGKELIGISPMSLKKEILEPYDPERDIMFMNVERIINFRAGRESFFIFFPDDVHRPCIRDGESAPVRKVVVKVKVD